MANFSLFFFSFLALSRISFYEQGLFSGRRQQPLRNIFFSPSVPFIAIRPAGWIYFAARLDGIHNWQFALKEEFSRDIQRFLIIENDSTFSRRETRKLIDLALTGGLYTFFLFLADESIFNAVDVKWER